jgi:DNA-binding transcriptional regulator GbsR (MarR family)
MIAMEKNNSPRKEFREIIYESGKAIGLDDFPSRLLSVLQSEKEGISLGELAKITGYSLSNLSTTIKGMENNGMVKKFKKPGSRKVYVVMDKDITGFFIELQKKRYRQSLKPSLQKIPEIINKYQDKDEFKEELEMISDYYQQIIIIAEETKKFIKSLEDLKQTRE